MGAASGSPDVHERRKEKDDTGYWLPRACGQFVAGLDHRIRVALRDGDAGDERQGQQRGQAVWLAAPRIVWRERASAERPPVLFYQLSKRESWMVIPRSDSSPSNFITAGEISRSPGTTTAHLKFSRNSRETMYHEFSAGGVVAPI